MENKWRKPLIIMGVVLIICGIFFSGFSAFLAWVWGIVCVAAGLRLKPDMTKRPAPVPKPKVPKKPVVPIPSAVPKAYQSKLDQLKKLETEADKELASIAKYLDQLFADSTITKDRYMAIVKQAEEVTDKNLVKASQAVQLFGSSVTKEREEILDGYIASSKAMIVKINDIITELIRSEQSYQIRNDQALEEKMNELKETTKYYADL